MTSTVPRTPDDSPASLAGATVVITRPTATSAALARRVRALGGVPLALPGLSLRALDCPRLAASNAGDAFDGWVFVSPAAVRFAFRAAPDLSIPPRALVCCVGAGTARALARRGIVSIAPDHRSDSEGLLARPELADVTGRRFALVGAAGGRNLIAPTLRERGARIEPIHVYERHAPRWRQRTLDALAKASDPLVTLLSSAEALQYLADGLPPESLARLRGASLVVASERIAETARDRGFTHVHVAASALAPDLLRTAACAVRNPSS